jgi:hypothetical protein
MESDASEFAVGKLDDAVGSEISSMSKSIADAA